MSPFDIVIIVLVGAACAAVAGLGIYRKIKHKGGCSSCGDCGCGCGHDCPACRGKSATGGNPCGENPKKDG